MTTGFALIPARGGSKRIPHKNMETIGGRTLVRRAVECAYAARLGVGIWVSTDDPEIADEAAAARAIVHPRRAELASDEATMDELARDFCDYVEATNDDLLLILEPSAPLREPEDLRAAVALLERSPEADGVRSVTRVAKPDLFVHTIVKDGYLAPAVPKAYRGMRPALFRDNGLVNVVHVGALRRHGYLFTDNILALVITDVERGVDVDEPDDLALARATDSAEKEIQNFRSLFPDDVID